VHLCVFIPILEVQGFLGDVSLIDDVISQ
jgi:hypothetical protein